MPVIDKIKKYKKIHMIAIGGTSMSGIAEILKNWGFSVTGSDTSASEYTDKLIANNIKVTIGHNVDDVKNSDLVIYSAAVAPNDIELVTAKSLNIPVIERGKFLGELTKCFQNTICISGTHGKSTTTSMVSLIFLEQGLDPTIQIGAILKQLNGNYKIGNSENFIIEACEYADSFLNFYPKSEIILNMDNDHLDYFKTFANIKKSFIEYVKKLPKDGFLILNANDQNVLDLSDFTKATVITYGLNNKDAMYCAKNILFDDNGFASFELFFKNQFLETISLSVPGIHNVSNSLAAISLCLAYGISIDKIKLALKKYTGAHRRFEYVGNYNDISIYDDYAHHPTEILATLNSAKNKKHNEIWAIFQPHTYSRVKYLLNDFRDALIGFDNIIITDIYAAREKNTFDVSSQNLVDSLSKINKKAYLIKDFNEIASFVKNNAKPNDIILTLGAGTITEVGYYIANYKKN